MSASLQCPLCFDRLALPTPDASRPFQVHGTDTGARDGEAGAVEECGDSVGEGGRTRHCPLISDKSYLLSDVCWATCHVPGALSSTVSCPGLFHSVTRLEALGLSCFPDEETAGKRCLELGTTSGVCTPTSCYPADAHVGWDQRFHRHLPWMEKSSGARRLRALLLGSLVVEGQTLELPNSLLPHWARSLGGEGRRGWTISPSLTPLFPVGLLESPVETHS